LIAEFLGTALLVATVVGCDIMAERIISPRTKFPRWSSVEASKDQAEQRSGIADSHHGALIHPA
jgi:glycerol uptake facilitator-like aquaporin